MNRAELIALASPPCRECAEPVQRVEMRMELTDGGEWVPGPTFVVCAGEHRVPVRPVWDD